MPGQKVCFHVRIPLGKDSYFFEGLGLNHDGILTDFCFSVNSPPLSNNLQICYQSEYDTYPQPVSMGFISITSGNVSGRGKKKLNQN